MLIKSFQIALLQQGHLAEFDTTGILHKVAQLHAEMQHIHGCKMCKHSTDTLTALHLNLPFPAFLRLRHKKPPRCHRKCPQAALSASLPGSQVPITETETIQLFADEALSRNGGNADVVVVPHAGDVDGRDINAKGFPASRKH